MFKSLLVGLFLTIGYFSFGQIIGGTLVEEGRKMTSPQDFVQDGSIDGWAIYELSVNRDGDVTGAAIKETNLKRTSAKHQIRNYVMTLKFEPGTYYPKVHLVRVKVKLEKNLD